MASQYCHADFRGKEKEHKSLSLRPATQWLHVISNELLHLRETASEDGLDIQKRFTLKLEVWVEGCDTKTYQGRRQR
jgi:hypothetical protein